MPKKRRQRTLPGGPESAQNTTIPNETGSRKLQGDLSIGDRISFGGRPFNVQRNKIQSPAPGDVFEHRSIHFELHTRLSSPQVLLSSAHVLCSSPQAPFSSPQALFSSPQALFSKLQALFSNPQALFQPKQALSQRTAATFELTDAARRDRTPFIMNFNPFCCAVTQFTAE